MVNKNNESPDMFKRLFSMMEKFTERLENIEKQIWETWWKLIENVDLELNFKRL